MTRIALQLLGVGLFTTGLLGWWLNWGSKPVHPVFEERAPHERGFAETFRTKIAPRLEELEHWRRTALFATGLIVLVGAAMFLGLLDFRDTDGAEEWLQVALYVVIGGTIAGSAVPTARFWRHEESVLLGAICTHFPELAASVRDTYPAESLVPYREAGVLDPAPPPHRIAITDPSEWMKIDESLSGSHRGVTFWVGEGEVTWKHGDDERQLLYGTLMKIRPPREIDPASLVEAKPVRAALDRLRAAFGAGTMRCGVAAGCLLVTMQQSGRARPLNVGMPWRSVYEIEPVIRQTLAQIVDLFAVIDAVAETVRAPAPAGPQR